MTYLESKRAGGLKRSGLGTLRRLAQMCTVDAQ